MNTRTWLNLGLLIVVAALIGVAYFRPGKQPPEPPPALTGTEPAGVARLAMETGGEAAIEMVRNEGRWYLTAPEPLPADEQAVQNLLDLLRAESQGTVAGADPEAAKYGLQQPEWSLRIGDHRIALGGKHPIKRQRFVRVDGTVHRVKAAAVRAVKSDWTGYVSPRLVPRGTEVTRIELPKLTLAKGGNGQWRATGEAKLDPSTAEAAAARWREGRAVSVKPYTEELSGKPVVTLHLADRDEPVRYAVQRGDSRIRLIRPDVGLSYALLAQRGQDLLAPRKAGQSSSQGQPAGG